MSVVWEFIKTGEIDNEQVKSKVAEIINGEADEQQVNLALEIIMYDYAGGLIDQITSEFGEEKLLEFYPEDFLAKIVKPPVILGREQIETIVEYAKKNLQPGKQLSLMGSFKTKAPIIESADLSGIDFSIISLKDVQYGIVILSVLNWYKILCVFAVILIFRLQI